MTHGGVSLDADLQGHYFLQCDFTTSIRRMDEESSTTAFAQIASLGAFR